MGRTWIPRLAIRGIAVITVLALALAGGAATAHAQGEGQGDLDEALVKKLDAESLSDLDEVAGLLRSALAKGLDDENESFARQMLGAISFQRGQLIAQQLLQGGRPGAAAERLRRESLRSLETAVENDPSLTEAHLLIARLNALPGGDRSRALKAASEALEQLEDEPEQQSEVYLLRSLLAEDDEKRMSDLDRAIEKDPANTEAWQARALILLQDNRFDEALADLKKLLEDEPGNAALARAAVETLVSLERYDEALELVERALEADPQPALYQLRAAVYVEQEAYDKAIADLNKAVELDPEDAASRLLRAELLLEQDDVEGAKRDLDVALGQQPDSVRGVLLRSFLAIEEGRISDAINDMQLLVRAMPENPQWALQLANLYQMDNRPRRAIEIATGLLERDSGNWQALRIRGDARLAVAEQAEAIADYERALEIGPDSDSAKAGLLNNLAWVLATSPKDELRDGERSVKLGTEAAELTEHKEAHVLSTLAAGYAETGDFEKAIHWAEKAVEVGRAEQHDQLEQLEKELESYRDGEPWREEQNVEENEAPLAAPDDVIDT